MNSTTHGLRSETLPPTGSVASDLEEHVQSWMIFYRPATPGERALLRQAATADFYKARALLYLEGHLDSQIRSATLRFEAACVEKVEDLKILIRTEPGKAVRALKGTALGCQYMIRRWQYLDGLLAGTPGTWSHFEGDEAIGLLGCRTVREDLRYAEAEVVEAYRHAEKVVRLEPDPMLDEPQVVHNYKQKLQAAEVLKKKCPDTYLDILGLRVDEAARARGIVWLRAKIAREVEGLRALEARLQVEIDGPERAEAVKRSQALEGTAGATWLRYARMHGLDYQRAYTTFMKGRTESEKTGKLPGAPNEAETPEVTPTCPLRPEGYGGAPKMEWGPKPAPIPVPTAHRFGRVRSRRGRRCRRRSRSSRRSTCRLRSERFRGWAVRSKAGRRRRGRGRMGRCPGVGRGCRACRRAEAGDGRSLAIRSLEWVRISHPEGESAPPPRIDGRGGGDGARGYADVNRNGARLEDSTSTAGRQRGYSDPAGRDSEAVNRSGERHVTTL